MYKAAIVDMCLQLDNIVYCQKNNIVNPIAKQQAATHGLNRSPAQTPKKQICLNQILIRETIHTLSFAHSFLQECKTLGENWHPFYDQLVHIRLFRHTRSWKIKTKKENKKSLVLTYAGCFPEETSKPVATIHPNQRPLNT